MCWHAAATPEPGNRGGRGGSRQWAVASIRLRSWAGIPIPTVSASAISSTPHRAASTASLTTRPGPPPPRPGTRTVASVIVVKVPWSRTASTTSTAACMTSRVEAFWLRLTASLTQTTKLTSSTQEATAWSSPRRSSTRSTYGTPGTRRTPFITASASMAKTSRGCANDTASIRVAPALTSWPISLTFAAVEGAPAGSAAHPWG